MAEKKEILTVIRPTTGWLDISVREILGYKDLILLFVKRDFVSCTNRRSWGLHGL